MAVASFYGPEALAYQAHINDPGIKTATRVNWTLFVVSLYVVGTIGFYLFATFRAKRDRLLTVCLIREFPNSKVLIEKGMDHHNGIFRLAILSAIVSGSIIGGAAFVQDSSLWWSAPQLHIPLVFTQMCGVFFVAGYFLLRSLAVNRIMRLTFEDESPPSIPLRKQDESDLYSQLGYHYLMMSSFALFSAVYLFLVWLGLQLESGVITPTFGFASAITWTVGPFYLALVFGLVFRPILNQRRLLQEWNKKRLGPLAEKIDQIVSTESDYDSSNLARLATYKVAYDVLESAFPAWPLHPNQARFVLATTTGLIFPFLGVLMRSLV
ncbi:MAG: hypothetical protein IH872_11210 [Chloroflexi bacterium]|nr:hypothetical protein [Chloroflexota bacterium]